MIYTSNQPLHLTPGQLRTAAQAWESGGHLALGLWAVRAGLKDWGATVYGELVDLVRTELGDDRDYSKEQTDGNRDPDHDHAGH